MSLESKELRIGSWYYFHNTLSGQEEYARFEIWTEALDFEAYGSPIPLTPEVMERCGFVKHESQYWNELWFGIESGDDLFILLVREGKFLYHLETEVKSLHHLQNLFWCLTDKELVISL